jgi:hypothetical protein
MVVLLMLGAVWCCWIHLRDRPPAWHLCLWLAAVVLTLSMERTVPLAAFLGLPLACAAAERALSRGRGAVRNARRWRVWVAAGVVGASLAIPLASARAGGATGLPTRLQPTLAALPSGSRILVDSDTSGWVMFALPHLRPVYDLRVESYSPASVKNYIAIMDAEPGWEKLLEGSGAESALVPVDAPIRAALTEQLRWTEVGADAGLVLLRASR